MEFLNIGMGELLVILFIALLVFGPERLPEIARQFGKAVRDFQRMSSEATRMIQEAIQEVEEPVKKAEQVVKEIEKDLQEEMQHIGKTVKAMSENVEGSASQPTVERRNPPAIEGQRAEAPLEPPDDASDAVQPATDQPSPETVPAKSS